MTPRRPLSVHVGTAAGLGRPLLWLVTHARWFPTAGSCSGPSGGGHGGVSGVPVRQPEILQSRVISLKHEVKLVGRLTAESERTINLSLLRVTQAFC